MVHGVATGPLAEAIGFSRNVIEQQPQERGDGIADLRRRIRHSPDFWLNVQRRNDLWAVMNTPKERERIERARPLQNAA